MIIKLYKSIAEKNRVDKTSYITELITLNGYLRDGCSIVSPSILIQQNAIVTDDLVVDDDSQYVIDDDNVNVVIDELTEALFTANYVYIPEFNRYYFVKDITSVVSGLWRIDMECDVLMSYKANIYACEGFIERNEFTFDNLVSDNRRTFKDSSVAYDFVKTVSGTPPFIINSPRYVLTCNSSLPGSSSGGVPTGYKTFRSNSKFVLTVDELKRLLDKINSSGFTSAIQYLFTNAPMEAIVSLTVYPLTIPPTGSNTHLYIGSFDTEIYALNINGGSDNYIVNMPVIDFYDESIDAFGVLGSHWWDYNDDVQLYIPFAGFVSVRPYEVYGKYVHISYDVDFDTGNAVVTIRANNSSTDNTSGIIRVLNAQIGITIPLSSTNFQDQLRNILQFGLSATTTVLGATSGNPVMASAGIVSSAGQLAIGGLQEHITMGSYAGSNYGAVHNPLTAYAHITRRVPTDTDAHVAHQYGLPLHQYKTIGDLTGMTVVSDVHLEGFETATSTELDSIEGLLSAGIIL